MSKQKHSASSTRWLKEHFDDKYVNEAKKKGYRSRAIFKIEEIQNKDKLLKAGMTVVDLGAAPGGWSQFAAKVVGEGGRVIACDLLPMESIAGCLSCKVISVRKRCSMHCSIESSQIWLM